MRRVVVWPSVLHKRWCTGVGAIGANCTTTRLSLTKTNDSPKLFVVNYSKNIIHQTRKQKRKVIQGQIIWIAHRDDQSGQWIGACDPIGVTTSGDTYKELVENITQVTDSVFNNLLKTGDLEEFLSLHGWKSRDVDAPEGEEAIEAPFNIEQSNQNDPQAAIC